MMWFFQHSVDINIRVRVMLIFILFSKCNFTAHFAGQATNPHLPLQFFTIKKEPAAGISLFALHVYFVCPRVRRHRIEMVGCK